MNAWVAITPDDVMAAVTGDCSPAEMRVVQRAYSDRITIEVPLPAGGLIPGQFLGAAEDDGRQWVLTVAPATEKCRDGC